MNTIKILIIGLGYAGNRYVKTFDSLENEFPDIAFRYAYVSPSKKNTLLNYFSTVAQALKYYSPDLVVVSVSDGRHAEVLLELDGYDGFIICEKPLVNSIDDLSYIYSAMQNTGGFCMDMVERYSKITDDLKKFIRENQLKLIRANFIWGKDRIHDHRSTCGALSEIIHPLDLIEWVLGGKEHLVLSAVIGTDSDFSISGKHVIDSLAITAQLGESFISGYSSFVNIIRQRTIDFIFSSQDQELIYARMIFDTPEWDVDHLKLWKHTKKGDEIIKDFTTSFDGASPAFKTIQKLRTQVREILLFLIDGLQPQHEFVDVNTSIRLQSMLNNIAHKAQCIGAAKYTVKKHREYFSENGSLEQLG